MSQLEVLEVKSRDVFGKRRIRRMRAGGLVPAVLYGHQQEALPLCVEANAMMMLLRRGHQIVNLQGVANCEALVKEVQWNVWGNEILHVDFTRIDANEKIEVVIPVVLKGDAVGLREGGVVELLIHEVRVSCSASNVPDELVIRVGDLGLGQSISLEDITLPEGVELDLPADSVFVHCVEKKEEVLESSEITGAEPEVIARKKEEGAEE
ncbi:MAG: 50S ribosomal protein L25 [Planctomycetia bacterium]|nr:50S ribosomal protein L25 [Planctomycetia bacterium]